MDFRGSICLSDIPKQFINTVNGKSYIKISVGERRSIGRYGETHFIKVYVPKNMREEGGKPYYIGDLTPFDAAYPQQQPPVGSQPPVPAPTKADKADIVDPIADIDLPF